jgi:gamma-glutamylcyclotransferase (GGCT)/AIG2-like uncharacterized protein YtfP
MAHEIDLFVYGTLMDEQCLFTLTGRCFSQCQAKLSGFERITPSKGYPYIVPTPGALTPGVLLFGIDPVTLAILDAYEEEGRLYHRCRVEATVGNCRIPCETYVGDIEALQAYSATGVENGLLRRVKP